MPSEKSKGLTLFGLLSRDNRLVFKITRGKVDSSFFIAQLDALSFAVHQTTVIVLDNARIHASAKVQACRSAWEQCGLFIFYLPAYAPHLNLTEILWRKLKYEWLRPQDYLCEDNLFYTVTQILAAVGISLNSNFTSCKAKYPQMKTEA